MSPRYYDSDRFLSLVDAMPLVSIDLLIEDQLGRFLVGRRRNRPALNSLFVPGGRILKDERLQDALRRVVSRELGSDIPSDGWIPRGVYEHFYEDNFSGSPGITTHYIVLPYSLRLNATAPEVSGDEQHHEMLWLTRAELMTSNDVHSNVKLYFDDFGGCI